MKYFLPLLTIALCAGSAVEAATNGIEKDSSVVDGQKRTYYLFVPDTATQAAPAPLLVTLHGSGRDGSSLVEKWKDLAAQEGFIVLGPDARDAKRWAAPVDGPDFLHDLIESLKSKYAIDPRRVYLFGHSAGAVFALVMSMMEENYFAATAVHAGAFREPAEYATMNYAERKIPLALYVGTHDEFFPLAVVRATRDRLKASGFPVGITEIPNHDHWYYDLAPKINRSAWDFLKNQKLTEDPKYHQYNFKNQP